jgi:hypothetical protein
MFLDESAFDVDDDMAGVPRLTSSATPKNQSGPSEIKSGRYNNSTGIETSSSQKYLEHLIK